MKVMKVILVVLLLVIGLSDTVAAKNKYDRYREYPTGYLPEGAYVPKGISLRAKIVYIDWLSHLLTLVPAVRVLLDTINLDNIIIEDYIGSGAYAMARCSVESYTLILNASKFDSIEEVQNGGAYILFHEILHMAVYGRDYRKNKKFKHTYLWWDLESLDDNNYEFEIEKMTDDYITLYYHGSRVYGFFCD